HVRIFGDKLDLADELQDEFHADAKAAVRDAAQLMLAESKRLIQRYGPNAPAPPVETPATLTGNLLRLTKLRSPRVRGRVVSAGVSYAPHAHLLEFGHVAADGTRVLPRPFVRVAEKNTEGPITDLLRARLT